MRAPAQRTPAQHARPTPVPAPRRALRPRPRPPPAHLGHAQRQRLPPDGRRAQRLARHRERGVALRQEQARALEGHDLGGGGGGAAGAGREGGGGRGAAAEEGRGGSGALSRGARAAPARGRGRAAAAPPARGGGGGGGGREGAPRAPARAAADLDGARQPDVEALRDAARELLRRDALPHIHEDPQAGVGALQRAHADPGGARRRGGGGARRWARRRAGRARARRPSAARPSRASTCARESPTPRTTARARRRRRRRQKGGRSRWCPGRGGGGQSSRRRARAHRACVRHAGPAAATPPTPHARPAERGPRQVAARALPPPPRAPHRLGARQLLQRAPRRAGEAGDDRQQRRRDRQPRAHGGRAGGRQGTGVAVGRPPLADIGAQLPAPIW